MKKPNNKIWTTIALILVLATSTMLITFPATTAQAPSKLPTHAFIGAIPNPVGVNQEVLLHVGVLEQLSKVHQGWEGLSITIERPDGQTDTFDNIRTDSTGGTGRVYVPDIVGIYELQSHFPEQSALVYTMFGTSYEQLYQASDSDVLELVVQADPLPEYPATPLPNEYWTRPIDAQHRDWYRISGDWLVGSDIKGVAVDFNEDAPETAHILWTEPYAIGGLIGGAQGPHAYEDGDAYQGYLDGSVIVNGIYVYNEAPNPQSWGLWSQAWNRITAIDIHTGEQLWSKPFPANERVTYAQAMLWDGYNNHGGFAYVYTRVGSTWNAYDPRTGQWVFTIENVPSGTMTRGPKGEILIYQVNAQNGWMALWNSTNIPALYGGDVSPSNPLYDSQFLLYTVWGNWWPWNKTVDATGPVEVTPQQPLGIAGYSWNVSIPTGLPGSVEAVSVGDRIFGASYGGIFGGGTEISSWALSLESGHQGELIYSNDWPISAELLADGVGFNHIRASIEDNTFAVFAQEIRTWYGFSMTTGDLLWTTESQPYLDHYQYNNHGAIAYGNLYSLSIAGIVYCYDLETGNTKWTYEVTDPYNEFNWGDNWATFIDFIADGKIYFGQEMHSPIDPKPRGGPYVCLDAITGDVIWRADGMFRQTEWGGAAIIGDSIMVTMDTYDNRLYAVGKGPSQTTVSITTDIVPLGTSIMIKGSVMDMSVGTTDIALTSRFPAGVPAVSDEDMSDWMRYVYKQFEAPADVKGVDVLLLIEDPNGDYFSTYVTTDNIGGFNYRWTPGIVGDYKVTAVFEGSRAFYRSFSKTAFSVDPSPEYPQSPTVEEIASESASRTIAMMPAFPDVPTQEQVADDAARRTIAMMPAYPTTEMPAYLTIDLVILIVAAVGVVIGLIAFMALRKQQ